MEVLKSPLETNLEIVLSINNVSKKYCRNLKKSMFYGISDITSELTGLRRSSGKLRSEEFWALSNINFDLKKGEAIGLLGSNGAGKTTLLKIISGLIKPDHGTVEVTGRLAPLIALGAGFNPILTGRENIFINMSILGLSKKEIESRYEEVVDFAEIGHAINAPVSTYSSGMAARLGFACAILTNPDILLIDEVLAVGDVKFRMKCYRKLNSLQQNGTSFILVSHSSQSILSVCKKGIFLKKGQIKFVGEIIETLHQYEEDLFFTTSSKLINKLNLQENKGSAEGIYFTSLSFKNSDGKEVSKINTGDNINLSINGKSLKNLENINIAIAIKNIAEESENLLFLDSSRDNNTFRVQPGLFEILVKFNDLGLKKGKYTAKININQNNINLLDGIESFIFEIDDINKLCFNSLYYQTRNWDIKQ